MKYIFTTLFSLVLVSVYSQNCFSTFDYFRPIELKPSQTDMSISAHTVAIAIDTKVLFDAGKLRADGADLRVTDQDCNPLPFFVNDISTRDHNVLYVAVADINVEGVTIQLYYGNVEETENQIDGETVFEFFDDFEDGVVDPDKWETIGDHTEWSEMDGEMRFTGVFGNGGIFQFVTPRVGFTEHMTYDFTANANNTYVYGLSNTEDINRVGLRYGTGAQSFDTLDIIAIMNDTLSGGSNPGIIYPNVEVSRNDINMISMSGYVNDSRELSYTHFENYSSQGKNTDTLLIENTDFGGLRPFFASFSSPIRVGFIGVRPVITKFPVITFGTEEMIGTLSVSPLASEFGVNIYPNPASDNLRFRFKDEYKIPVYFSIMSTSGIEMNNGVFQQNIDISSLPTGMYFLRLTYEAGDQSLDRISILR